MKKHGDATYGILCLALGLVFLTGCDLLGLGSKKQNNSQKQPETTVSVAPASQSPQEVPGPLPGNVLVRIGNWTLTQEDFNNRLGLLKQQFPNFKEDANSKNAVLDELVRQQLLVKDAEDSGIGNAKEVKDAVEDFRKTLLVQELASRLTKDVAAGEDDARAYYEANKSKFTEPINWDVRQIVVGDEAGAKSILVQILQGGDFAQIAQAQSKDAASASQGGKLKPFITGKAPFAAMQTAIANLDAGGISAVFKGPEGYYIVKVDSKTGGVPKSFADVKKDLIYGLTLQRQQAVILNHIRDLAEKNKPEYNKDLIEQVVGKITTP